MDILSIFTLTPWDFAVHRLHLVASWIVFFALCSAVNVGAARADLIPPAAGFQGLWYSQPSRAPGATSYKYSGGLATYPQQHAETAIYSATANRTFFVYGGSEDGRTPNMISYFDHETGLLARPRTVISRNRLDGHENPTLSISASGHLSVFSSGHGARSALIFDSENPYDISSFNRNVYLRENGTLDTFSYAQPHEVEGEGTFLFHTHYDNGKRNLYFNTREDDEWGDWQTRPAIAELANGQYQVSASKNGVLATAFNVHPTDVDSRTNLYFLKTSDFGETWTNVNGDQIQLPLTDLDTDALVFDYESLGKLVYLKDIQFDSEGNPVLLYTVSDSANPDDRSAARTVHVASWDGAEWQINSVVNTDHNYDHGELDIRVGEWVINGTFIDGPQSFSSGGELGEWVSYDDGATWSLRQELTSNSVYNHHYPRRVKDAHEDFQYFWADGNAYSASDVRLYFRDGLGNVYQMPEEFDGDFGVPMLVASVPEPGTLPLLILCLTIVRRRGTRPRRIAA